MLKIAIIALALAGAITAASAQTWRPMLGVPGGYYGFDDNGDMIAIRPHPSLSPYGRGYTIDGPGVNDWNELRPNAQGGYDVDNPTGRTPLILPPLGDDD